MGCCSVRDHRWQPPKESFDFHEGLNHFSEIENYALQLCQQTKWDIELKEGPLTVVGKKGSIFDEEIPVMMIQIRLAPRVSLAVIEKVMQPAQRLQWDKSNLLGFDIFPNEKDSARSNAHVKLKFPWPASNRDFYETRLNKIVTKDEQRSIFYSDDTFPQLADFVRGNVIFGMTRLKYDADATVITMITQTDTKLPVHNVQLTAATIKNWALKFICAIKIKNN